MVYIVTSDGKSVTGMSHHRPSGKTPKGTSGSVTALFADNEACRLISGAKDGSVGVWETSAAAANKPVNLYFFTLTGTETVGCLLVKNLLAKQIQSVCRMRGSGARELLLIGTRGCDLLEVECAPGQLPELKRTGADDCLIRGHCNDELWGLATHPTKPEYCTVGT